MAKKDKKTGLVIKITEPDRLELKQRCLEFEKAGKRITASELASEYIHQKLSVK